MTRHAANVAKFRSRFKVCACAERNNVIMAKCMRGENFMRAGDEKLNFNE